MGDVSLLPSEWGEASIERVVMQRLKQRYGLFVGLMGSIVVGAVVFGWVWFEHAVWSWSNYYIVYFYLPLWCLYIGFGCIALLAVDRIWLVDLTGPGMTALLRPSLYGWFARWNQTAGWIFVLFMALNLRPVWLWGQVNGARFTGSPCGWASCSRNHSALFDGVYNPRGWFPNGRYDVHDPNRLERYTFCNFRAGCRWADAVDAPIVGYPLFPHTSLLNFDQPASPNGPLQGGYASQRIEDYPPAKGLALGWQPAVRVNRVALCPANILTDATVDGRTIYGLGEEICSVCHLYERHHAQGGSSRDRALNKCRPNADESINPLCGICPGEAGWFHNPWDSEDSESMDPQDLADTALWCVVAAVWPLGHLLLLHMAGVGLRIAVPTLDALKSV